MLLLGTNRFITTGPIVVVKGAAVALAVFRAGQRVRARLSVISAAALSRGHTSPTTIAVFRGLFPVSLLLAFYQRRII